MGLDDCGHSQRLHDTMTRKLELSYFYGWPPLRLFAYHGFVGKFFIRWCYWYLYL